MVIISPETIRLLGGALCLDFANSVDWTDAWAPIAGTDALQAPDALERWGRRLGVGGGSGGPEELVRARELRAALYGTFSALAEARAPEDPELARLRSVYAQAVAAGTLGPREDGGWTLDWPAREPRRVRFAVAADAVALLADPASLARVRRCPGRDCGWLFLDTSGRRRWCSMATCGSREKMRRMTARRRAGRADGASAS